MEKLPADVLYEISSFLSGKDMSIKDKLNNTKQISKLCKVNKRFNQLYCQNDKVWKDLWLRDISSILPNSNIKNKYIEALSNINTDNSFLNSIRLGYDQAVKNEIDQGAVINWLPVSVAISHNRIDILKYLLSNGGALNSDLNGSLRAAANNNSIDVIIYLNNLITFSQTQKDEMLIKATEKNHFKLADYLISIGANIHADIDIIVRQAAYDGDLSLIKYAVKHGANIHALNDQALEYAIEYKHPEVVEYLESL